MPSPILASCGTISAFRPTGPVSDELARKLIHAYRAASSFTDANIGRVLAELDRLGLRDNTIVVLWGDHGWKLGEHASWCKHSNMENDTNAPLILAAPSAKAAGQSTAALVEFVDIYPTLCDLAGLPLPTHLQGVSMKPLLDDPARSWKSAAFSQYPRSHEGRQLMGYAMRTDRYRYVEWRDRDDGRDRDSRALRPPDRSGGEPEHRRPARKQGAAQPARRQLKAGWQAARPPGL